MDALAEKLDTKLRHWRPETAAQVRERVIEVIELADDDVLDMMRSRAREQEVLDPLDEQPPIPVRCGLRMLAWLRRPAR